MSSIKNKIITISGEPASGKSTVVRAMKEKYEKMGYKVEIKSVGNMFRNIVVEAYEKMHPDKKGLTLIEIQSDPEFLEIIRKKIDTWIDNSTEEYGKMISSKETPNVVYIIDSRLAWQRIPNSFAVRLTVDEKIAGKRVFQDTTRGNEDKYKTLEDAIKATAIRKQGEIERYKERYGVDLTNPDNYDLIVDTAYSNTEELADIIIKGEEAYRAEQPYPKTWASPALFLTLQTGKTTSQKTCEGYTVESLAEKIKENGYDNQRGTVDIVEKNGIKFLLEGNHRTLAALANGQTLIPYKTVAKDNEYVNEKTDIMYTESGLERIFDWADSISYYGDKIGKIKQLKDFSYLNLIAADKIPIYRKALKLDLQNNDEGR